jgi:hypothetical protein
MQTTEKTFKLATEDQATREKAHEPLTHWQKWQQEKYGNVLNSTNGETEETENGDSVRDYYLQELLIQNLLN